MIINHHQQHDTHELGAILLWTNARGRVVRLSPSLAGNVVRGGHVH